MKQILSIDWLQVWGHNLDYSLWSDYPNVSGAIYRATLTSTRPGSFRKLWKICLKSTGKKVAEVMTEPNLSTLASNMFVLKLENFVLYQDGAVSVLGKIVEDLHLKIMGITRVDMCVDFQECGDGRDPQELLQGIAAGEISIKGFRKMHLIQTVARREVEYVRFGSAESEVHSYIYNKSKELREVKDKPYIREIWENAGFDMERDTYRAEISIKGRGLTACDIDTGELLKITWEDFEKIEPIWQAYADKYLYLLDTTTGKRKRKNMPRIEFLDNICTIRKYLPISISRFIDSGRTERICANMLIRYMELQLGAENEAAVYHTARWLERIANMKRIWRIEERLDRVLQMEGKTVEMDILDNYREVSWKKWRKNTEQWIREV